MRERPKLPVEPRAQQQTPAAMVASLMQVIHGQFYGDAGARTWPRDQHYIRREVVLWPASWLKSRGLTMTPSTYETMFLDKLNDVKRNCAQAHFDYFPAYLAKCIRDHFKHNEERIHNQCKAVSGGVAALLSRMQPGEPDLVDALTAARDVLLAGKRPKAAKVALVAKATQKELFS